MKKVLSIFSIIILALVLYACGNTHTVTFNTDGGTDVPNQIVVDGGLVTRPVNPTKDGYTFVNWYHESTFVTVWDFTSDTVTSDVTIYAKFTLNITVNQFTVSFNTAGGSNVPNQTIAEGGLVVKPTNPTKSGYTFVNWYHESTFVTAWDFTSDTVTSDVTIYAKFELNTVTVYYTVNFNTDGGSVISPVLVEAGHLVSVPADPMKDNHLFIGWFTSNTFLQEFDFSVPINSDVTVYAKFELIYVTVDVTAITLMNTKTFLLNVTTNDPLGVSFTTSAPARVTVDENGLLTGHANSGTTIITITANSVSNVSAQVTVTSARFREVTVSTNEVIIEYLDEVTISFTSSDPVNILSSNSDVATLSTTGELIVFKPGQTTIRIELRIDASVYQEINVVIKPHPTALQIIGPNQVAIGNDITFLVSPTPANASTLVIWSVSDDGVAMIDDQGVFTPKAAGHVVITILHERSGLQSSLNVEVINTAFVDPNAVVGSSLTFSGITLEYGKGLFSSIEDALSFVQEDARILLFAGNHTVSEVNVSVTIEAVGGAEVIINSEINVFANNVTFFGMIINGGINLDSVTNILLNRVIINATNSGVMATFITDLSIVASTINAIYGNAVEINDIFGGEIFIRSNNINSTGTGIYLNVGSGMADSINISRNNVIAVLPFDINTGTASFLQFVRFNDVSGFDKIAARVNEGSNMDFSLNYWGMDSLDLSLFENITEHFLAGTYFSRASILPINFELPIIPAAIIINNPTDVLRLGDTWQIELSFLPHEYVDLAANISISTTSGIIASVNVARQIIPNRSGNVTINIRAIATNLVNASFNLDVTTDPGVNITATNPAGALVVGTPITLMPTVFPVTIANTPVRFVSSDETVATINNQGVITSLRAGTVRFRVEFDFDGTTYFNEYQITFVDSFNLSNPLDFILSQSIATAIPGTVNVNGFNGRFVWTGHRSVNHFLFDDLIIDRGLMVPAALVGNATTGTMRNRSTTGGRTMPDNFIFNEEYIAWIVIHDTASVSAGARAHAELQFRGYTAASWHYQTDHFSRVFQSFEDWMVCWHAGDGTANGPGQNTATHNNLLLFPGFPHFDPTRPTQLLGGGNRNGIGIETGVVQGHDMFRTWQVTAKLVAELMFRHNLPINHVRFHIDFSGKTCPNAMLESGHINFFLDMVRAEYQIRQMQELFPDLEVTMISSDPTLVANDGRVLRLPLRQTIVEYTINVTQGGVTQSQTLAINLPGTRV